MAEITPASSQNAPRPTSRGGPNFPGLRLGEASVNSKGVNDAATSYNEDATLPYSTPVDEHGEVGSSAAKELIMNPGEALTLDPSSELDLEVRDNKFAFSPRQMSQLVDSRSLSDFRAVGGLDGLEKGLRTDRRCGLSSEEMLLDGHVSFNAPVRLMSASAERRPNEPFVDRKRVFGDNNVPTKKPPNFLQLMWMTYNDYVLFLLTAAATISLGIGLYQSFGTVQTPNNPPVEWIEGVAILVAIVVIVLVGSVNDYQKQRQFEKLNKKKQDRYVKVIRSGKPQEISIFDILVGDVVHLESGDVIPADGILIDGHNVRCDESTISGESHLLHKHPGDEVFRAINAHQDLRKLDPFVISGAKVAEGIGTFFVTATGVNSSYGKILMSLRKDPGFTPLQVKLNTLAKLIAKLGGAAALLLFVVLFIKFLIRLPHDTQTPTQKGQMFLNILIIALTILVIAIPEGLPLAVTLALAFATTKMLKENNLVRQLKACETMGNVTSICSDKTGTLTQNKMTVVAGTVGTDLRFGNQVEVSPIMLKPEAPPAGAEDVSIGECVRHLADDVKVILRQSIVINSTAFEGGADGRQSFIGSKTETALLAFARDYLAMESVSIERSNAKIVQLNPFDAARQCMATVVEIKDGKYRLYVKGASEVLLAKCTRILQNPAEDVSDTRITVDNTEILDQIIASYASRSLRTIGLVFRDFEQWPPAGVRSVADDKNEVELEDILQDLVFLSVMGIQDPLRDEAAQAVRTCQKAGVVVRMVTGDNILTAKAIAKQCGILSAGDIVMEGLQFRKLSKPQMNELVPRLRVLARASPEDKRILVTLLKDIGETVAVTGDGTNDAPALAAADVGFSMGVSGTEVAREASSIVLMDDDFSSIVTAITWGRAVNDAVKKFLQVCLFWVLVLGLR
jgi:Ca2+-transporting ATPase